MLNISPEVLKQPPEAQDNHESYRHGQKFVVKLHTTNDLAERCIRIATRYNGDIWIIYELLQLSNFCRNLDVRKCQFIQFDESCILIQFCNTLIISWHLPWPELIWMGSKHFLFRSEFQTRDFCCCFLKFQIKIDWQGFGLKLEKFLLLSLLAVWSLERCLLFLMLHHSTSNWWCS